MERWQLVALRILAVVLCLLAGLGDVRAQEESAHVDRVAVEVTVNGDPVREGLRVYVSGLYGTVEAKVEDGYFLLPAGCRNLERIAVGIAVAGYDLDLGEIASTKFTCSWAVAIDSKPFDPVMLEELRVVGVRRHNLRQATLVARIRFDSDSGDGTALYRVWYNDRYRRDAMPPN
jgi:hypothetical protein